MKILAYGGNEYSMRTLIGEWPGISTEYLGDLYGIPSGSPSFGLIFPGGSPALLYRERINPQYRGGYPYTVLLDLGPWEGADTLWSRAGWNAAGLLECMFGLQSSWRATFMTPERLSTALLNSVVEEILAKRELDRFAQKTTKLTAFEMKWASFLAGSLNSEVPVVAPPRALGIDRRPTMAELASLSSRLPTWLRTGRGWMVGGSYTQAAGFGAGALLDDEPFGETIDPSSMIRDGNQLQSLLQQLSASPATAEKARALVNQPAINWPDAKQFFDRARLLRKATDGDDSEFPETLPEDGALAAEIFAAAFQNAQDKAHRKIKIGPNQTRAILESRRRVGPTRIPRAMVPYLDAEALGTQLDAESAPPLVPEYLELPPDLSLARCKHQMIAKKGDLTRADLERWRWFLRETEAADAEVEFLKEFAQRQPWLAPWKSDGDSKLNQILKQQAASRLRRGPDNAGRTWLYDSLFFLPVEEVNAELEKFKGNLDASLRNLTLQLREEPRQLGAAARAWLKQLASSSLRNDLAVETKLAIAYENPPGWANFWSLSQALHKGKPFAGKEVPKEERAILALECMDLLRLYAKSKQLSISVQGFVQIAKLLELQKRFAVTLSDLASDPQFQRYYEALQPGPKKGAVKLSKPEANVIDSSEVLAEASKLRHAIEQVLKAIADRDRMIAPDAAQEIEPDQYDDLADLLLIDWARDKSPKAAASERNGSEEYGALPTNLVAVLVGVAGLILGATAWYLRLLPQPIHFLGPLGAEQHRLPLELAGTVVAIIGLALLVRGFFPPTYTVTLPQKTVVRAKKVVGDLLAGGDPYTNHRCGELIKSISQSRARNFSVDGSFDWLLLLYLGSGDLGSGGGQIAQLEPGASDQLKRLRGSILFALDRAGLIRKRGWFRG
jgi:hypothetical protein